MGNSESSGKHHLNKSIDTTIISSPRDPRLKTLDDQIESDLYKIKIKLDKLNVSILNTREKIKTNHDNLQMKLAVYLNYSVEQNFTEIILGKRSDLIRRLTEFYESDYNHRVGFIENRKSLYRILVDAFFYINKNFDIYHKIKYINLYNQCESIDANHIPDNCYNHIFFPISKNKIFYCLAMFYKKSFIKITNRNGETLCERRIKPVNYYKQFLAYGKYIVGLYEDVKLSRNTIEVYDDSLNLIASKSLYHNLELVYLNNHELVCKSLQNNQYVFFNFKLEQTYSFRVILKEDNVILNEYNQNQVNFIGTTGDSLFLFHEGKKFMRRIDREKALANGFADLVNTEIKSYSQIKLDKQANFILKGNSSDVISYYDYNGKCLISNFNENLKRLNNFDINHEDEFYTCDLINKKIHFM